MTKAWTEEHLNERLFQQGFDDVIEFAKCHPDLNYEELARILDKDLVPIQLLWSLREEAIRKGEINWFAKDSLVRNVREICQEGWLLGEDAEFDAIHARSSWISEMVVLGEGIRKKAELVRDRLKMIAPQGWLPIDVNDSVIQEVFSGLSFNRENATVKIASN
jgi:hypothetical protein